MRQVDMFYRRRNESETDTDKGRNGPWSWQTSVAALQEILTYCLVGLSVVVRAGIKNEVRKEEKPSGIGIFITRALVATHGETAADPHRLIELIQQAVVPRDQLKEQVPSEDTRAVFPSGPADFQPATTFEGLLSQTRQIRPEGPGAANTPTFFLNVFYWQGFEASQPMQTMPFFLVIGMTRFLTSSLITWFPSMALRWILMG